MGWLVRSFDYAGRSIRSRMVAGIAVIVPLLVTIWVIRITFGLLDGWLRPIEHRLIGRYIPGTGFLAAFLLVYLIGLVVSNLGGKTAVRWTEKLLMRLPVIGDVYGSSRQIMETFTNPSGLGFKRVVTIEFPRPGSRCIGFVTRDLASPEGERQLAVFVPTVPNPTTGFLLFVSAEDVIETGLAVDEALKMVVSGGIVVPKNLRMPSLWPGATPSGKAGVPTLSPRPPSIPRPASVPGPPTPPSDPA